jgi:galactokinase
MTISNSTELIKRFKDRFGHSPAQFTSAPGRVNLIGEHTDYNDGFVLPMAIERRTTVFMSPREDPVAHVYSSAKDQGSSFPLDRPIEPDGPPWTNYIRGVTAEYVGHGFDVPGFNALIHTDVPIGAGLSSSASLEIAFAYSLECICNRKLSHLDRAMLCQHVEHVWAGVPCGIMDQLVCSQARSGHALLIDCRTNRTCYASFDDPSVTILIVNSNVNHELADSQYKNRREQCSAATKVLEVSSLRDASLQLLDDRAKLLGPVLYPRARHVVTENLRTLEAVDALNDRDWDCMGELMYASHRSLRDDYDVSCSELDIIIESASQIGSDGGIYGARMTGAGFGGSAVMLVKRDLVNSISKIIIEEYHRATGMTPTIFTSSPADGIICLPSPAGCFGFDPAT